MTIRAGIVFLFLEKLKSFYELSSCFSSLFQYLSFFNLWELIQLLKIFLVDDEITVISELFLQLFVHSNFHTIYLLRPLLYFFVFLFFDLIKVENL